MIDPEAEPIGHRSPYKRVDLAARRRPRFITREDYENGVIPDEALYEYNSQHEHWVLK
jgi:hypothetical protein